MVYTTTDSETETDVKELFDLPTEWQNYGDADPDIHGGQWIKFDPEYNQFDIVETTLLVEVAEFLAEDNENPGEQYVKQYSVGIDEMFDENGDFTDTMQKVVDQFQNPPKNMMEVKHGRGLPFYAVDFGFFEGVRGDDIHKDSYDDVLEYCGVEL